VKAIYLTGFMGTGKTTIGRALGEKLNLHVYDTDEYIVKKTGKEVKEIFNDDGEEVFRDFETEAIQTLSLKDIVITTGGGLPVRKQNREWMKNHGTIVYLYTDLDVIFERLQQDKQRPLALNASKSDLAELYESRKKAYDDCSFMVDTTAKEIADITEEIIVRLKKHDLVYTK
jgi:shikimate kinase